MRCQSELSLVVIEMITLHLRGVRFNHSFPKEGKEKEKRPSCEVTQISIPKLSSLTKFLISNLYPQ